MNGRGYTINELLLVVSLSAMLALAALPEIRRLLASWEMQALQTELHGALLLQRTSLPVTLRLSSNFGHYARYRPNGRSSYASGAFMAGTWRICSPQLSSHSRKLVMSYGGRVRRARVDTGCPT